MKMKKITGLFFASLTIITFFLFIFGKINPVGFWVVLGLSAFVAYFLLPRMK